MMNHAVANTEYAVSNTAYDENDDLHFEARINYDYFRIEGATLNYDVLKRRLQAIIQARGKCERNLILLENNFRNNLSITDLFWVITDLPAIGYSKFRLAIADSNPNHKNNNDFANTVADNRGLRMRAFSSVRDAEGWLLAA
jgi:hypothetical protein